MASAATENPPLAPTPGDVKDKKAARRPSLKSVNVSSKSDQPAGSEAFQLDGLVAAVFTPMKRDGTEDINLDVIPDYVRHLASNNIRSVFVNGTTGEGNNLTVQERKRIADAWMRHKSKGLDRVVVHIGGANLKESQELAAHAKSINVDAIAMVPPSFFKPSNLDLLIKYCQQVADSAPDTPFYYYHIPVVSGVHYNMVEIQMCLEERVRTYRGSFYSHWDMTEASLLQSYCNGKFNLVFGVDQQLLAALTFGVKAGTGATFNFMAPVYQRLLKAFQRGDLKEARALQVKSQQALDTIFRFGGGTSALKHVTNMTVDFDLGPARVPLVPELTPQTSLELKAVLHDIGFFESLK